MKTLFEDQIEDVFFKNARNIVQHRNTDDILGSYFYISTSPDQKAYQKYFLELQKNLVFCKKNESENNIGYMDIKNSFMRLTNTKMINGRPHYGIRFVKKSTYEEIFTADRKILLTWYNKLKKQCILTRFRTYFKTKRVLGKGSYAKVFLVERISDKKQFAVKVFNKTAIMKDQKEFACFIQELETMRFVNHERVMKLHELYEGENYVYCLCDFYKGQSLFQEIVQKGPQPEQKALTIIYQILQGLDYLHDNKIIHRDLKPQNIIFKSEYGIDMGIIDFGFATQEQNFDKIFKDCGTPGYMAPEILQDKNYNCKVDVFSCGVILFIILTGKVPFGGYTSEEIIENNKKAFIDYQLFNTIGTSKQTINLLKQMLQHDPQKRISTKEALNHVCFQKNLSISPLILRPFFQDKNLQQHKNITYKKQKTIIRDISSKIEDLSPSPIQQNRIKSPYKKSYINLNTN